MVIDMGANSEILRAELRSRQPGPTIFLVEHNYALDLSVH